MTVKITTEYKAAANGAGRITAKAKGKQRTVAYSHADSIEVNHMRAAGVVGNLVLDAEQQAKIWHPSGRQRVHVDTPDGHGGSKRVVTLDV